MAELVQAVNPLEIEAVWQRLGGQEPLPEDIAKQVSDLTALSSLAGATVLNLSGVSAADLGPLAGLKELRQLSLDDTQVADLGPLAGLKELRQLYLHGTRVADLGPLAGLKDLHVYGAEVAAPA